MTMTDPIADLLTRIRNGLMAAHESVDVPHSRLREEIVQILTKEGYLTSYSKDESRLFPYLRVVLKYTENQRPAIQVLRRVSKPGRRVYAGKDEIPDVLGGLGINVVSTSKGLMTGKAARGQGIGGEVLCEVY